jgi:hypothetical protein
MEEPVRAFLSYSHDSPEHVGRALAFADALRAAGIDAIIDQHVTAPADGWTRWMDNHIDEVAFVLLLCDESYRRRVMGREEPGIGLGVRFEGKLIYNRICQDPPSASRFIPILFAGVSAACIPTPLLDHARYEIAAFDFSDLGFEALYRHLTAQPNTPPRELGPKRILKALATERTSPSRVQADSPRGDVESKLRAGDDRQSLPSGSGFEFARLRFQVDELVCLHLATTRSSDRVTLTADFGFNHKPLAFVPNATAPAACGCTMAMLMFRVETPHEFGRRPVREHFPNDCDVTRLFVGSHPRISLKIRHGASFLNGTGTVVLEIGTDESGYSAGPVGPVLADSGARLRDRGPSPTEIRGHVRLHPECFQVDWLHVHQPGHSEDLQHLQRDAGILMTALIHKAQRSRKLNQRIPPPAVPAAENRIRLFSPRVLARIRSFVFRRDRDA